MIDICLTIANAESNVYLLFFGDYRVVIFVEFSGRVAEEFAIFLNDKKAHLFFFLMLRRAT